MEQPSVTINIELSSYNAIAFYLKAPKELLIRIYYPSR